MNNILDIRTPAEGEARALKSDYGLGNHGLDNLRKVYWNLPSEALYEETTFRREGRTSHRGALVVRSGKHTARAAGDKYIVREPESEDKIWWGEYNRPISLAKFGALYERLQAFLQGRDVFVQDCYVGADPNHRLPIRVITELAWHSSFARNMFILPESAEDYKRHVPEFTVIAVPSFNGSGTIDGTRTSTFIALSFDQKVCIIGDTAYGGEIKKSVFTLMNFLMPQEGVMSMHCSANVGERGDVALFFGLSGTGKTSLSADPDRYLIGDDEHGWSEDGIFNFEGGCYAKVIRLSPSAEPEIYACTRRFGTILENVIQDPISRRIDLDDNTVTENTRASYPLEYIDNAVPEKMAGHPENIVLLTCDASGVLPPIARLTPDQALYQFISGYTSKIAGTEAGVGEEPEITFSTCFGAPFMVHHPAHYADLLKRKMLHHGTKAWLLNTGWTGGAYGVGKRISIRYTRAMLSEALSGGLEASEFRVDPLFGFEVPTSCAGVPDDVLDPASGWPSKGAYRDKYRQLAARYIDNFKKFAPACPPEVVEAGPKM